MTAVQSPPEMNLNLAATLPVTEENTDINLMALTMAALRLVNPWTVEKSQQWSSRVEPGSPAAKENVITLAEVSHHDSYDDCWVVIYDRVYDITSFFDEHPGGDEIMMEYAGRDASTAFRSSGHSRMAIKALDRFVIGELPMQERMYRRPGGIRLSDIPE